MSKRAVFSSVDPATNTPLATYDGITDDEAHAFVMSAKAAFHVWRKTSFAERAIRVGRVAEILMHRGTELARMMTREIGKPVGDGQAEIVKCAVCCAYFAQHAEAMLARESVAIGKGERAFVTFQPMGVVLAIMPWNFPFWQVIRCAAPTLMAGNAVVLKHANNVPQCAMALESIFIEAGFPEGLFKTLLIDIPQVDALISHPDIAAVSLTGSVKAGKEVAVRAGAVLKKCVLELGGSDAYVVLADADVAKAAQVCATARMVNGGQSCVAGKRFIVSEPIREAFTAAFVEAMKSYTHGDPTEPCTRFGPLVSIKARDGVHAQVEASVAKGATLLLGGEIPHGRGAFYPATVLADVAPGQPAYDDEIFGPVAAIISAKDDADAIRLANDSRFGLGSAVLTSDLGKGERIAAEELEAGMSFVNANVSSDWRLPFGGVKESGYGREVSRYGLLEFVTAKTVVIADAVGEPPSRS